MLNDSKISCENAVQGKRSVGRSNQLINVSEATDFFTIRYFGEMVDVSKLI